MSPRLHVRSLRPVVAATGSLALAAGLCLTAAGPASAVQTEWAFDIPGHSTWTVPAGVTSIEVELWGAAGSGAMLGGGGAGAYVDDVLVVTPGETLDIYIGGAGGIRTNVDGATPAGGYNGGGAGGTTGVNGSGAGGGGATDIRIGGTALTDRVVVAGGGGGSGGTRGGDAGLDGSDGTSGVVLLGGGGGTQESGGVGADGFGPGASGGSGADGALGVGGAGQTHASCRYTGAGGGGGYYGGGGGGCEWNSSGSGGGGGSSLVSEDGYVDVEPNPDGDYDGYALVYLMLPDSPEAPTAVAGDGAAEVSWSEPFPGSMEITGYTVTASPGGATCSTTGALACSIDGLTNGTAYSFTVVATSDAGDSEPSEPSAPVTPQAGSTPPVVSIPAHARFLSHYTVLRSAGDPAARLTTSTPAVCRVRGADIVLLRVRGACQVQIVQDGARVASGSIAVGRSGSGTALTTRRIGFRDGSAYLSPAARARLAAMAPTLRRATAVVVTGWTSGMTTTPRDTALSRARARAVASYLAGLGVSVTARTAAGAHWLGSSPASRSAQLSWYVGART